MSKKYAFFLNRCLFYLVILFVFIAFLPHTTAIQSIVIGLFYLIFFLHATDRFKTACFSFRTPLSFPILFFGVWAFIGLFFAVNKSDSIKYFEAHFFRFVLFYFIIFNIFTSEKKMRLILWTVILSAVSFSLVAIIYAWGLGHSYLKTGLVLGIQKNNLGYMLILAILFCLTLIKTETSVYKKKFLYLSLLPLVIMVIIPQCRGTIAGAVIAILVLFLRNRKQFIGAVSIGLILLILVLLMPYTKSLVQNFIYDPPRVSLGYFTVKVIEDYPIFGTGISHDSFHNIRAKYPAEYDNYISDPRVSSFANVKHFGGPHFMLGLIAASTGIPGLILFSYILLRYFLMILKLFVHGKNDYIKSQSLCLMSAFIMFMMKTLFEPIFLHEIDMVMYLLFAMGAVLWSLNKKNAVSRSSSF